MMVLFSIELEGGEVRHSKVSKQDRNGEHYVPTTRQAISIADIYFHSCSHTG